MKSNLYAIVYLTCLRNEGCYRVEFYDRNEWRGSHAMIDVVLKQGKKVIMESYFGCSPMHSIDSHESIITGISCFVPETIESLYDSSEVSEEFKEWYEKNGYELGNYVAMMTENGYKFSAYIRCTYYHP